MAYVTALHIACNAGAVSTARVLIDRGADVSQPRATGGDTPLLVAAAAGREEIVRLLLSYPNTDVNHRNAQGATPLIIASQRGHCLVVRRLLAKRADCYRRLTSGRFKVTALGAACRAGHLEIVQVLLAHMSASYDLTMTSVAARTRSMRTSCARSMQFRCARVKGNYSALCHACANGHVEVVRILLEHGIDPFRTGRGRNAFAERRRRRRRRGAAIARASPSGHARGRIMTRSDDATRNDRASKDAGFVARRRGRRRSLGSCARARAGVAREHVARGGECATPANRKNQAFLPPPPGSSESQSKKSGGYIMETTFCLCLFSL